MVKKQKLLLPGGRFTCTSACANLILIVGNAHEGKGILHDAILLDDSLFYRLMIFYFIKLNLQSLNEILYVREKTQMNWEKKCW